MAELKISGNMKVKTLKERFQNEFDLTLRIYKNGHVADDHLSLSEIRSATGKGGLLKDRKNTLVKNIASSFEKQFGIKLEVFSPDGEEPAPKDMTLQQVVEIYSGDSLTPDSSDASGDMLLKEIMQSNKEESPHEIASKGHEIARQGHNFNNKENLKLAHRGTTIAHFMALEGHIFDDPEILKLEDKYGKTVAYEMARQGYQFKDQEIWKWADDYGETVAHEMARKGYQFEDPEILKLEDEDGETVADIME